MLATDWPVKIDWLISANPSIVVIFHHAQKQGKLYLLISGRTGINKKIEAAEM